MVTIKIHQISTKELFYYQQMYQEWYVSGSNHFKPTMKAFSVWNNNLKEWTPPDAPDMSKQSERMLSI